MKYERVHIGSVIKEVVKKQKKTFTSFAQDIGIQKQNVEKKVFSQQGLDTDFLMLISEKLDYNFFEYFSLPPKLNFFLNGMACFPVFHPGWLICYNAFLYL
jgi:hypothetical protein